MKLFSYWVFLPLQTKIFLTCTTSFEIPVRNTNLLATRTLFHLWWAGDWILRFNGYVAMFNTKRPATRREQIMHSRLKYSSNIKKEIGKFERTTANDNFYSQIFPMWDLNCHHFLSMRINIDFIFRWLALGIFSFFPVLHNN